MVVVLLLLTVPRSRSLDCVCWQKPLGEAYTLSSVGKVVVLVVVAGRGGPADDCTASAVDPRHGTLQLDCTPTAGSANGVVEMATGSGGTCRTGAVEAFAVCTCLAQPRANSVAILTLQRCNHLLGWWPQSMSCCLARSANLSSKSFRAGPCLPKTSTATPVTDSPALHGYSRSLRASPHAVADLSLYLCAKGHVTVTSNRTRGSATSPHASTSTRGSFLDVVASSGTTCSRNAMNPAARATCSKMAHMALWVFVRPPPSLHNNA